MWNQSAGGQIGALLQSLAQNNPQVFQAIMQMVQAQRQQGVGGIGSLGIGSPMPVNFGAPGMSSRQGPAGSSLDMVVPSGGMSPRGDNSMIGQAPMGPMPMGRPPGGVPGGGMFGMTGQQPTNPLPFNQRFNTSPGPRYPAIPMPTGVSIDNQQPYTPPAYSSPMPEWSQPSGPKYMPPTGPKVYGQTTPAQPPAFVPPQPKVYPQTAPMAGDGTTGLDWYAQQAGN